MHLTKLFRCLAVFLMLGAMSGCRTSGTWNSPSWTTSSWNPSTWSLVGSTPPSLASKDSGLKEREPYLASGKPELPSTHANPTQTPTERLAAQNRAPAMGVNAYPETTASYNNPAPGGYPNTAGGYGTPAQPASYRGTAPSASMGAGVGEGTPYMAPQQNRYDVPPVPNGPAGGSGYQGTQAASNGGGLVNPPTPSGACQYNTGSERYGLSAPTSPRYANPGDATQPYSTPPAAVGNTGYQPGSEAYQPPAEQYQPGNTGYQPGNTGYQPGNTGYTPPGSQPYQPPQPGYQPPQPGYQSPQPGSQPAEPVQPDYPAAGSGYQSPQPYQPPVGNTTSTGEPWRPGGTSDYRGAPSTTDSQVVPTQYVAPEPSPY